MELFHVLFGLSLPLPVVGWMAYGTFRPASNFWGKVLWKAPAGAPAAVSLTFDDGPSPAATPRILDILDELNVKATFFVIGQNAVRWPQLVKEIDARGHVVANHTFDHSHTGIMGGTSYWTDQIRRTDETIGGLISKQPAIFRPPMGHRTCFTHRVARCRGQKVVTWTRKAADGIFAATDEILARLSPASAGDILVMHDGIDPQVQEYIDPARPNTVAAIKPLVNGLRERGLGILPLDELLGIRAYCDEAGMGFDRALHADITGSGK